MEVSLIKRVTSEVPACGRLWCKTKYCVNSHVYRRKWLKPVDKLPSECEFAEKLQVAAFSVREALRMLELSGLIEKSRGEGTYYCEITGHIVQMNCFHFSLSLIQKNLTLPKIN